MTTEIDLTYHIDIADLDLTDGSGVYDEIQEELEELEEKSQILPKFEGKVRYFTVKHFQELF